jgi:hypothetical protein
VQAAQITPNPNPSGSTIDIINDPFAVNNETPYSNGGTINIDTNSTLTNSVGAGLTNDGVGATLTNAGRIDNYGGLGAGNYATLTNSGTLNNFAGASLGSFEGGSLTNAVGGTVNNYGAIGTIFAGSITNAGTLNNFAGSSLGVGGIVNAVLFNTGTLNNFAGASLHFSDSHLFNSVGGTLNNFGTLGGEESVFVNGGTLNNVGSFQGIIDVDNSVGATLNNYGSMGSGSGIFFSITNAGTLNNVAGATMNIGVLSNTGTLTNAGTLNHLANMTNTGTVINTGIIAASNPYQNINYIQTAGHTINNGTLSQSGGVDIQGGSLRGTGTIITPVVTLSSGAILSPGDATTLGTLTINGNLQSSGNLLFNIGGSGAGQFDVLAIHGKAFLNGGTVGFNFVNFTPVVGNSWDFLSAEAISGWETLHFFFSSSNPDLTYAFNYSNGVETLRIVSVPEPSSLLLSVLGLGGLALWRRLKGV